MASSDEKDFLQQIIADPNSDGPRLVFADWLEEHGQIDRAEFIRVQIQRAALPKWHERQLPLLVSECALLKKHEVQWRRELPELDSVIWGAFRRGFVSTAKVRSFDSIDNLQELIPLEALAIAGDSYPRYPRSPIKHLRELTFSDNPYFEDGEIDSIAQSPVLSTVETLKMNDCSLGALGLARLLKSPHLKQLKRLDVSRNSIGNDGIGWLVSTDALESLEELDLSAKESYSRYEEDSVIDASGLQTLSQWTGLEKLRVLSLSCNDVGSNGLRSLMESNKLANLKELFFRNALESSSIYEFSLADSKLKLDVLDLGENVLYTYGTNELCGAPCLSELKWLMLDRCEISPNHDFKLPAAAFFDSLRRLNLNDNTLDAPDIEMFLQHDSSNLHTLQLANNDLQDLGAELLAHSPAASTLQAIDLSSNRISGRGVESIATSKHLEQLLVLKLDGNKLDPEAGKTLMQSSVGKQLVAIDPVVQEDEGIPF